MAYRTPPEKAPSEREERVARRELPREFLTLAGVIFSVVVLVLVLVWVL